MAQKVPLSPQMPLVYPEPSGWGELSSFMKVLLRSLFDTLRSHALRLNGSLPRDGSEEMSGPLFLQRVPLADLPSAVGFAGSVIYVHDAFNGPVLVYSNGTDWLELAVEGVVG